ncbi:hypothetical protein BOTBODRAFT_563237 [Botryobasidium botryosum FD-172 SS1]|uniref:Aminoglycoside phosphotransferase domain-containing protein n=1 Tax=Botryobasidium botryosum (strain FD-172 SS1) TaxID=930990 RepID=A0A067MAK9_BOTB1|nr:hypothetical protein BOTBODRAFT_563237 [Botryobasidium botryosum FD-172 SS1]
MALGTLIKTDRKLYPASGVVTKQGGDPARDFWLDASRKDRGRRNASLRNIGNRGDLLTSSHNPSSAPGHSGLPSPSISIRTLSGLSLEIFKFRLQLGRRFLNLGEMCVCRIGWGAIAKFGPSIRFTEALTMKFVAESTTIPIPRVLDMFTIRGRLFMVMEYIDAPSLDRVWHTLSATEKRSVLLQLQGYLRQLRSLRPPHPGIVEAADGTGCLDKRQQGEPFGPFTVDEFHTFLGHDYLHQKKDLYPQFQADFERCAGRTYDTHFTHGDLAPRNILVRNGSIVGIIDWECAGWFPSYWEYTRNWFSNFDCQEMWELFQEIADPYPDELRVEQDLADVFFR